MKKIFFVILFFCITSCSTSFVRAQTSIQWQKSLGGSGVEDASSIQQTTDRGYIVVGFSNSTDGDVAGNHGSEDYWVVKLDSLGAIQWQKSLGGSGRDIGQSIQQTTDGGYIVVGFSNSIDGDVVGNHGGDDCWIVKINSTGEIKWQKSLGGSCGENVASVQPTTDGGYIIAGISCSTDGDVTGNHGNYDYWVVKLNSTGVVQWQKSLGGTGTEEGAISIRQTHDGGYIVTGSSASTDGDVTGNHGGTDCWIVKLDFSGSIQWQKSLGGSGSDKGSSIQQTTEGGYIVAGSSSSIDGDVRDNHGNTDCWIVKLDFSGAIQWQKPLGGSGRDRAYSIQQTTDGGYIVAGGSESTDGDVIGNHGNADYWIVKLDSSGTIQSQKSLGGSDHDIALCIQQARDGGYVIAGYSKSTDGDVTGNHGQADYWVVKIEGASTCLTPQAASATIGKRPGDEVVIPIVLDPSTKFTNAKKIDVKVKYDPRLSRFVSVTSSYDPLPIFSSTRDDIALTISPTRGLSSPTATIAELHMQALLAPYAEGKIEITSSTFTLGTGEQITAGGCPVIFSLDSSCIKPSDLKPRSTAEIEGIYPNPSYTKTTLVIVAKNNPRIKLEVYDTFGRQVEVLQDRSFTDGKHELTVNTESYATGIYFCQLIHDGQITTTVFNVQR